MTHFHRTLDQYTSFVHRKSRRRRGQNDSIGNQQNCTLYVSASHLFFLTNDHSASSITLHVHLSILVGINNLRDWNDGGQGAAVPRF